MATTAVYSIDTSALIHAWHRAYRPRNFGFIWKNFDNLIDQGRLRASIEVFNEIARKDDDLLAWCKERKAAMFVDIDDSIQIAVAEIMAKHQRMVDTTKGRSGGDPFVIALAACSNPKMVVVSEEYPGAERIPSVCLAEGIDCCKLADMIEREDWQS
jgi:hypothetical protein